MKALRSFHWLAASESSESSIRMAKYKFPPWRQSATCTRSLPSKTCTSSFLIGGGEPFLATAVTVRVTGSAARTGKLANEENAKRETVRSRGPVRACVLVFMKFLLFLDA